MKIYNDISELIGGTPILRLSKMCRRLNVNADILGKLEYFNPAGSVKDRIAKSMLDDAEQKGLIKSGSVIIEPTSGNTGIGLAMLAAARAYRLILTMPETMSGERRALLKAYGAELVLTEGSKGMNGAIEKAYELLSEHEGSFMPAQFKNPANPQAHIETTGPEIWNGTDGNIDIFVACVGSAGTITGTGRYLKSKNPNIKVIAVEPSASPLLSKGVAGSHKIQGIGANFVPEVLDRSIIDRIITVADEDAFSMGRELARTEGVLAGISSGAALAAAAKLANESENAGKSIVAILPDTGERYLSAGLFSE